MNAITDERRKAAVALHRRADSLLKTTGHRNLDEIIDLVRYEPDRLGNAREEAESLLSDLLAFLGDAP